jgi:uracil-DNA glycosylase
MSGATAAQPLLGKTFLVSRQHGKIIKSEVSPNVMATVHPSSILRSPDDKSRYKAMSSSISEVRNIRKMI